LIAEFAAALAFLTRLPVGRLAAFGSTDVARSARWFPFIGALLGAFSIALLALCANLFPAAVTAILLAGLDALLTGALHLDGLADTADGFGGGASREDVLRIMRDHAIGSYGAVALILVLALKIAATASLIGAGTAFPALLLTPVLGRWSVVALSAALPYARPVSDDRASTGGSPARFIGRVEFIISTIIAIAVALAAGLLRGPAALVLVALGSTFWGWCCRRRIGGVTGDTLGAGLEISECLTLLLFAAFR